MSLSQLTGRRTRTGQASAQSTPICWTRKILMTICIGTLSASLGLNVAIARDVFGKPLSVASGGATWTLNYNHRRLPSTQVLNFGGQNYTLSTSYDANGNVSQLQYPSENNPIGVQSVAYAPDALGRPTQAAGQRCGTCRPDIQGTNPASGRREYTEYDTVSSGRGAGHAARLNSNDPAGTTTLIIKN